MRLAWMIAAVWLAAPCWSYVEVVKNGRQPQGTPRTLHFTVDLKFGADEAEETYLWPHGGTTVTADGKGNIYVSDPAASRVLAFDSDGKFLRIVATKGSGPNEFQNLFNFTMLSDGRAVGFEGQQGSSKFKFFDDQLLFQDQKQSISLGLILIAATVSPGGDAFGAIYAQMDQATQSMKFKTGIFNMDFKNLLHLSSADRPSPDISKFSDPEYLARFLGGNLKVFFKETGFYNFDQKGTLYTALSSRYQVTKWNADYSAEVLTVSRDYQPIPNPQEEIDAMTQSFVDMMRGTPFASIMNEAVVKKAMTFAEPPPVKNPIFGILPMEDGSFLVVHDVRLAEGRNRADIFSAEGSFLGSTELGDHAFVYFMAGSFFPRMIFKNGFAYTVTSDDLGDNRVVRYTYELAPL